MNKLISEKSYMTKSAEQIRLMNTTGTLVYEYSNM